MIEDILNGKSIEAQDAVGVNTAISKLEEAYFLAVETGRDADFNRKSLFKNILATLFPYLKLKWASEVAKAQAKGKKMDSFENFLSFLTIQKRIASEMQKLDSEKSEKPTKNKNKPESKEKKRGRFRESRGKDKTKAQREPETGARRMFPVRRRETLAT